MTDRRISLKSVKTQSNEYLYMRKCSIFRGIPDAHRQFFTPRQRLSLFLRRVKGCLYYYIEIDSQLCAYLFLKRNYFGKYSFMSERDYLINPYYTMPNFRQRGLATALIRASLEDTETRWSKLFAVVTDQNLASQRVLEQAGFSMIGYVKPQNGKNHSTKEKSGLLLYRFER